MEDRYRGTSESVDFEFWFCPRCKTERPKYVPPKSNSKVVVAGMNSGDVSKSIEPKPVPVDETAHFDKLNPVQKITKLLNRNSGTDRPKPITYFCPACQKERITFKAGTCPICARRKDASPIQPDATTRKA